MTVEAYKTSEDIIQRTIGTVEKNQRYSIYKAELFPQYYSGNGIELHHPADLATTEAWFEKSFPTNQFKHKTITFWPHAKEFRSLITEAINNGYTLDQYQVMALSLWRRQEPSYNDRYEVVDIKDQRLSDLFKSENQSSPWYKETGKEIWQKSILLHTKIDTKWHIIGDEDTCYSQVGVFRHQIYRWEDAVLPGVNRHVLLAVGHIPPLGDREAVAR